MILTGQMNRDVKMTDMPVFKQIRETLQSISQSTGYSPKEVGEAMLGVERQFAGLSLDKRLKIENTISPYAAAEARLKETDFKEFVRGPGRSYTHDRHLRSGEDSRIDAGVFLRLAHHSRLDSAVQECALRTRFRSCTRASIWTRPPSCS